MSLNFCPSPKKGLLNYLLPKSGLQRGGCEEEEICGGGNSNTSMPG